MEKEELNKDQEGGEVKGDDEEEREVGDGQRFRQTDKRQRCPCAFLKFT